MTEQAKKPPIGAYPRWLVIEQRINDLDGAISRYMEARLPVKEEWVIERNELIEWLKINHVTKKDK